MPTTAEKFSLFGIEHTGDACPICSGMMTMAHDQLRSEMVLPVPASPRAPTAKRPGPLTRICFDCSAAETVSRLMPAMTFAMARVAVGNERQEQLRLPGAAIGLVREGLVRPSATGDMRALVEWRESIGLRHEGDRAELRALMVAEAAEIKRAENTPVGGDE